MTAAYWSYWGKAMPFTNDGSQYHLLPYHCLDVAAVALAWWRRSKGLRLSFARICASSAPIDPSGVEAWLMFFVALHDVGKFDARFQRKAEHAIKNLWSADDPRDWPTLAESRSYAHGPMGFHWFCHTHRTAAATERSMLWLAGWASWLGAVAGHHGEMVAFDNQALRGTDLEDVVALRDADARQTWLHSLASLFLEPAGLRLIDSPPLLNEGGKSLVAGFCAVADWLGSKAEPGYFEYCDAPGQNVDDLRRWLERRRAIAEKVVHESGLLDDVHPFAGVAALLDEGCAPRQVQTVIEQLPLAPGLTLIEAPTGCGKTEAALGHAWRLLAAGLADSIVFALPTQATANAMLVRLEKAAILLFAGGVNVVLAHGKSQWNDDFYRLKEQTRPTAQGVEEAWVQCRSFLAQSRKRAFLGQIGVCTVDQVLLSVLPFKHKFVRGFGIAKSVLIVDEVHAYSHYTYGLLEAVLRQQAAAGGSAILLSATLPAYQRKALIGAWGATLAPDSNPPYPLLTSVATGGLKPLILPLPDDQQPEIRKVFATLRITPGASLTPDVEALVVEAVAAGALVGIVCNLVDEAQATARRLRQALVQAGLEEDRVDLFHARYRFVDRADIEKWVVDSYGKGEKRSRTGRVLVATQVIEQSLDLDFDWLITQLCPADLLFQRLGRLHRHSRVRPSGFEEPRCTVLAPEDHRYGLHEFIYGNARVLWRTEQLLRRQAGEAIFFPAAYRDWIEQVYARDDWEQEPETVSLAYDAYIYCENERKSQARRYVQMTVSGFTETEHTVGSLTRDGEMSLPILPLLADGDTLLNGAQLSKLPEGLRLEAENLQTVRVPASWKRRHELTTDPEGLVRLCFKPSADGAWRAVNGCLRYSVRDGMSAEAMDSPTCSKADSGGD